VALNRFKSWISGYPIYLFCDYNSVLFNEQYAEGPRTFTWTLALKTHELAFHYKAGNFAATIEPDYMYLSRMGPDEPEIVSAE
jgi:hypothetical protein